MKIKTADLDHELLDWAVATARGYTNLRQATVSMYYQALVMDPPRVEHGPVELHDLPFHNDWALAGSIIEVEKICIDYSVHSWFAGPAGTMLMLEGRTPLVAAMRAFVAFKLGDTVDVPDHLAHLTSTQV